MPVDASSRDAFHAEGQALLPWLEVDDLQPAHAQADPTGATPGTLALLRREAARAGELHGRTRTGRASRASLGSCTRCLGFSDDASRDTVLAWVRARGAPRPVFWGALGEGGSSDPASERSCLQCVGF